MANLPPLDVSKFKLPPLEVNKFKKTPETDTPSVGGSIKTAAQPSLGSEALKNTTDIYKNAPTTIAGELTKGITAPSDEVNKNNAIKVGENALGATARTAETIFAPFSGAAKAVTDAITEKITSNPAILNSPVTQKIADLVTSIQQHVNDATAKHPEAARNVGNAISVLLALVGGEELDEPVPGTSVDEIQAGKDFASKIPGKVVDAVQGIDKISEKAGSFFKGKTEENILATPEDKVYKLKPNEQKIWYDNAEKSIKSETQTKLSESKLKGKITDTNIEASHGITKEQIAQDLNKKIVATNEKATALDKELSQKANTNVEELRKPARDLNTEKGKIFGQMRDEAIKGKENVNVKKIQLSKTIDETVSDPNVAAIVKNQLGITGTGRGGNITLGEIYDRVSSLKETVGNYNPSDYANNQAIKVLNNIMKENGVDFSAANKMWSEWAPIKERIDSAFDVYNKSGLTTDTQASKLISAAKGVDAGNVKFVKTLQDMTGEDFTTNIKETIAKMDANEKAALANKVNATVKNMENDALKADQLNSSKIQQDLEKGKITQDQADKLDALNSKKYTDLRKAWKGRIIKWAVGGGAGTLLTLEGIRKLWTGSF